MAIVLVVVVSWGLIGVAIAHARQRSKLLGFMLGVTGLVGWIVLAVLPTRQQSLRLADEIARRTPQDSRV